MLVLSQFTAPKPPVTVTLVRCAGGQLDDDNATGSMKAVRDEVARWLGVDDGDASVRWRVEQRRVATKDRGTIVRVEVLR
jgi:hypothetical protein